MKIEGFCEHGEMIGGCLECRPKNLAPPNTAAIRARYVERRKTWSCDLARRVGAELLLDDMPALLDEIDALRAERDGLVALADQLVFERAADATSIYEAAYKSLPPVDFGSAAARQALVPRIAKALEEAFSLGGERGAKTDCANAACANRAPRPYRYCAACDIGRQDKYDDDEAPASGCGGPVSPADAAGHPGGR